MIEIETLREDPDRVKRVLRERGITDTDVDKLVELDERWRKLKSKTDGLKHEHNQKTDRIEELMTNGKQDEAETLIDEASTLSDRIDELDEERKHVKKERDELLLTIPNIHRDDVPVGNDEGDNVEVRRHGFDTLRTLPDNVTPHYELGDELEIIDEHRGQRVAKSGYYFTKGEGAMLEHALIQFMLTLHREQGYVDLFPPIPVDTEAMTGTGQLPKFADDAYSIEDEDLWLCPTAEVPVTNMYAGDILLDGDLPLKHQAYTPNFRREAGESGTKTRGIARVHQFNKVELVNFVRPENSYDRLDGLLSEAEAVLEALDLPYRVIELCTGDLTFASAKTYDIEVWAPGTDMDDGPEQGGRWLEVSSVSNFEDYQARRAGLRYRPKEHEAAEYLHTLNGSGLAIPRVMIAILEYYQNDDGTVTVPESLRPYMGGREEITGHSPVGESARGVSSED